MNISLKDYINVLAKCILFRDIKESEIISVTELLCAYAKVCGHNEIIIRQDEIIDKFGIVLKGSVTAIRYTASGNGVVTAKHGISSVFGEILACHSGQPSPVNVTADADSVIMFINYSDIFKENTLKTPCCVTLIKNLASLMAQQYFSLERKLRYLSIQSIRQRITEYLADCCSLNGGSKYTFTIPYDREGMAQYLNINRSALSRELSRMKNENLIDFNKNQFRISEELYSTSKHMSDDIPRLI